MEANHSDGIQKRKRTNFGEREKDIHFQRWVAQFSFEEYLEEDDEHGRL